VQHRASKAGRRRTEPRRPGGLAPGGRPPGPRPPEADPASGPGGARPAGSGDPSGDARLESARSLLSGQNRLLEMIARDTPLHEVLTDLTRLIERHSGEMLCSVLLLDDDGLHLSHGAAPSLPESYTKGIDRIPIGPSAGSCGTAAFFGKPVIVTDIATDPLWESARAHALAHGLRACWSTPIKSSGGKVQGTFAMYYREPRHPSPCDLELTDIATHLAGIAIGRHKAEAELRQSEQRLRDAQRVAHLGSWEWNIPANTVTWSEELYRIFGLDPLEFRPSLEGFLGRVHPDDRDAVRAIIEEGLKNGQPFTYEARILRPDGSPRTLYVQGARITDETGNPIRMIGVSQDITPRKRMEEERARLFESAQAARAEVQAALERLQAIQSVTDTALAHLVLDDLLRELLARVCSALPADAAVVFLLDEDRTHLTPRATAGLDDDPTRRERIALGRGIAGRIAQIGVPQIVDEVSGVPGVWSIVHERLHSLIGVPLVVEGQVTGVLQVGTFGRRQFRPEDMNLLQLVADRVAPAIDRARLFEEVHAARERLEELSRRLVELQEAERRVIARELHDEVGQKLTGLKLLIESGGGAGVQPEAGDQGGDRRGRAEMASLINDLVRRVRDLSMNLRPAMLDDLGLLPALLWHFERFTAQTAVRVEFQQAGLDRRFPPEVETAAFRIVQEALTNVARHAGVNDSRVQIWAAGESLEITVEDRGRGFRVKTDRTEPSSGLAGMRERTRLLGGQLTIDSAPGSGTRLVAEIPFAPSPALAARTTGAQS
jgi:PAS domain S-box-containing protein